MGGSAEEVGIRIKRGYIYRNEVKCNGSVAGSNLSVSIMPRKVRLLNTSGSLLGRRMREWERQLSLFSQHFLERDWKRSGGQSY